MWVKDRIKEDPSILGLGKLELKSVEAYGCARAESGGSSVVLT